MPTQPTRPYHHGDLRPALLRAAVEAIGQAGPAAMSLREVARRAGVNRLSLSPGQGRHGISFNALI